MRSTSDGHSRLAPHNQRRAYLGHDQSTVLVLSTDEDTRDDALRCGEALSAVLLECTLAGMATCTLTQLTELWSSRNLIGTLTGRAAMQQIVIRVGEAPAHWRGTPHDAAAATSRCSDVSPRGMRSSQQRERSRGNGTRSSITLVGSEGGRHQAGQVGEAVGVTPLVVVPADDLHQITSDFGEPGIKDARRRIGHDVGGDDGVLGVGEEALQLTVGGAPRTRR